MSSPQPLAQWQQAQHQKHQEQQYHRRPETDSTPTPTLAITHPHQFGVRPTLPARDVTAATIEDAYVRFIFYCNPALPLSSDTRLLREAFRNPPRSGGKIFNPFTIFELVRKFYHKEIKTWTELTTTLGVEPPDLSKDESAQKVAQYGVRLKKWMNSMRVKAFFEYLMNIPNDYWTKIPSDPNPISLPVRDGVAVEDDMALRALLPHIRPKRGRRRPDSDDVAGPPSQRQRLSPPSAVDGPPQEPWSAHPDNRAPPLPSDPSRLGAPPWVPNDSVQTPIGRWPHSAVTPSTRSSFWDDALEPRSAVTPSKAKVSSHRRGAKNVSSAWKPGGPDGGTKPRGRPPINRTPVETPNPPMASWAPTPDSNTSEPSIPKEPLPMTPETSYIPPLTCGHPPLPPGNPGPVLAPMLPAISTTPPTGSAARMGVGLFEGPRPPRPSITLQVPERPGGSVRLATPPPIPPISAPIPPLIPSQGPLQVLPLGPALGQPPLSRPQAHDNDSPPGGPPPPPPETSNGNESGNGSGNSDDNGDGNESGKRSRSGSGNSNGSGKNGNGNGWDPFSQPATGTAASGASGQDNSSTKDIPEYYFENMEDRTNMEPLLSYFSHVLHNADWVDRDGNQQVPAGMDECVAMVNATVEHMYRNAESSQAFLINLAALCGAKMLMVGRPRCYREESSEGVYAYYFDWRYRFGNIEGEFTMTHSVPIRMWKKPPQNEAGEDTADPLSAEYWQKKYTALMEEVEKRDQERFEMENNVMKSLRGAGDRTKP